MALSRRQGGGRFQGSIWPGFVDAMTGLLLVLMFVLTIFMVVQFVLRETIKGQDSALSQLQSTIGEKDNELRDLTNQLKALGDALGAERNSVAVLQNQVTTLQQNLSTALSDAEKNQALILALTRQRDGLQSELDASQTEVTSLTTALATTREEIDAQMEAARLDAAKRELLESQLADIKAQAQETQLSLTQTLALLADEQDRVAGLLTNQSDLETQLTDLEKQRAQEAAAARILRERLDQTAAALSAEEQAKLTEALAVQKLEKELENARNEITAIDLALEQQRQEAEDTLTLLAAARRQGEALDERLATALLALEAAEATQKLTAEQLDAARSAGAATTEKLQEALARLKLREQELASVQSQADVTQTDLRTQLANALAAQRAAEDDAKLQLSEAEKQAILLSTARTALAEEEAETAAAMREVEVMNQQLTNLRDKLAGLQAVLGEAAAREADSLAQIQNLGDQLNSALAEAAIETQKRLALEEAERKRLELEAKSLERVRSEFLAQMRDVMESIEGVKLVGDRFVFSSEVLFAPGQATLSPAGRDEIAKIATRLLVSIDRIPNEINWVLQVDGHTDNIPIRGDRQFANNWELSQARALSVVVYLSDVLGFPANRLSANGYGEFQPINPANTAQARAQNRRIELKFTEK